MSKFGIGVGEEFPLDEKGPEEDRHAWKMEHRARRRAMRHHRHGHHHGHHHHHHRHHGFGRLALLLVVAGLAALIVEHRLPAEAAYGMVGVGAAVLVLMFVLHALWHRRMMRQPPTGTV